VSIRGIEDTIEVLPSLQRPKKIAFLGSDGRAYTFLAKPKDDLRKDTRMMEFNALLNRILAKSPASRRRNLYIRTFTVIPLSEDCGLVEWVPNTRGIRHILQDLYENAGLFVRRGPQATHTRIKQIYDKTASATDRMSQVLSMLPPIFHQHFLQSMPEPGAWARARTAFAHTAGVWSMVGHIVGLGDRHGENILIDGATGDCVHVDFSCLFDKGLDLELPELVPFRCTQNMVDGMGVSGVEGVFLSVCEIVLDILRSNRETLMTVLETFVHDPLVEWTKQRTYAQQDDPQLFSRSILQKIRGRLEGRLIGVGSAASMQLAPRGHARRLVEEATAWDRLGKMYIWWMAWL
jgi:serine/threonine-protein kinase ATR